MYGKFDLDLRASISISRELYMVMSNKNENIQKLKFKGQSFQDMDRKQTDERTDGGTLPIALPSRLTRRSVKIPRSSD